LIHESIFHGFEEGFLDLLHPPFYRLKPCLGVRPGLVLVPHDVQCGRTLVWEAIGRNPRLYLDLPEQMRGEYDVARMAIQVDGVDNDVLLEATERCPRILSDRTAMLLIARSWWTDVLHKMLQFSPLEIRGHKEIMLEGVRNNPTSFEYCSEELANNWDVVLTAVGASPTTLCLGNASFQVTNPDLVILTIKRRAREDLWALYGGIHNELWMDRDVAMAWLSRGGDWLVDDFPVDFESDRGLLLTVAWENVGECGRIPKKRPRP
jgi:Domain of unknown function (DUF4116)